MQILAEAEDLPKTANIQTQLISLWTAPVVGVVLLVAFVAFPGFWPPMSPTMSADQVAQFYRTTPRWSGSAWSPSTSSASC